MQARTTSAHALGAPARALLLLCAAALAPAPAVSQSRGGDDSRGSASPPTLTVTGTAQISVDPDEAVVRLGVVAQAAEASDAQQQVNRIMQQVLDAVTGLDVPEQAVRTEELSLFPVYGQQRAVPQDQREEPRITGYRASNVVSVELDDLAEIGDVVDAGIMAGANQLQGISFRVRDDAEARARAMQQAVQEARTQAEAIARSMGMRIEGVRQVVAGGSNVRPPVPFEGARLAAADFAATPVQPGEVDVSASVTVTYELNGGAARGRGN
jgi:hypothetical protein